MNKNNTINRILNAAETEFSLRGIDGAKIETIARTAGVTKQLIYHYFKNKDLLYRAILEQVSQDMQILSNMEAYAELSPEEAIQRFINAIFDNFAQNPNYATLTLDQALHQGEHISQSSRFIPTLRTFISKVLSPTLQRGSDTKIFKPNLDTDVVFWMIFNLSTACFLNEKIISETSKIDFSDKANIETWRHSTVKFVLDALRL